MTDREVLVLKFTPKTSWISLFLFVFTFSHLMFSVSSVPSPGLAKENKGPPGFCGSGIRTQASMRSTRHTLHRSHFKYDHPRGMGLRGDQEQLRATVMGHS